MISVSLEVQNQKGTPMLYQDTTANIPSPGIVGRLFFATTSPYGIFTDTGAAWQQIAQSGASDTNIYNTDGTLTGNRAVNQNNLSLTFNNASAGITINSNNPTATLNGYFGIYVNYSSSFTAGFVGVSGGYTYCANNILNAPLFNGNATFNAANILAGTISIQRISQATASAQITISQAGSGRMASALTVQNQYQSTVNSTITHLAGIHILGNYRTTTGVLTITNYYGLFIADANENSHATFINKYGIYQAGTNDPNIFASSTTIGGTNRGTLKALCVNGDAEFITTLAATAGGASGLHLNVWANGTQYKIALLNV